MRTILDMPGLKRKGAWIGVDLDGTLATYTHWIDETHIGDPIPLMANRVKLMLKQGIDVRIFTARVDGGEVGASMGFEAANKFRDVERVRSIIQDWTEVHFGVRLPVTCKKDFGMVLLFDDRAIRVTANTGEICCDHYKKGPSATVSLPMSCVSALIDGDAYGKDQVYLAKEGAHPCKGCDDENSDGERCVNDNKCVAWSVYQNL